jgi:PilZ domain-containing protein
LESPRRDVEASDATLSGEIDLRGQIDADVQTVAVERRAKTRIRRPFAARVRGIDIHGLDFQLDVGLENISSRGLYLRIPRTLKSGDDLNLLVQFSNGSKDGATASLRGRVLRVEPGADGLTGIALAIQHYEFV